MEKSELLQVAKPMLFNTDMVQAILAGRKTQTRRLIKLKYSNTHLEFRTDKYGTQFVEMQNNVEGETWGMNADGSRWHKLLAYFPKEPPHKPGDIVYVRETWRMQNYGYDSDTRTYEGQELQYRADFTDDENALYGRRGGCAPCGWRPSIHMPKEAARIFLRVKRVWPERLQDITLVGIIAEGIIAAQEDLELCENYCPLQAEQKGTYGTPNGYYSCEGCECAAAYQNYVEEAGPELFEEIWNNTVKPAARDTQAWAANPWVWVYEFERMVPNNE